MCHKMIADYNTMPHMFSECNRLYFSTRGLSPCAIRISEKYLEILNKTIIFAAKKNNYMRIISKSTLVEYYTKEPKSKTALEEWYEKTKKSEWFRSYGTD